MPLTFFAHQAPLLPVVRRWPGRLDGVTLVVGSMAPDMAYVLVESRFQIWAHVLPSLLTFCLPVTLVVSWILVRVLAPVVPDHLPQRSPWFLRDYRGLATHRFRPVASSVSAVLGALSHAGLDHFTHDWGWFATNISWYDAVVVHDVLGRDWSFFRLVQYTGHVVGTLWCLWMLARYGRCRWMRDRADRVAPAVTSNRSRRILSGSAAFGAVVGLSWVVVDNVGVAADILRVSTTTFVGLTVGALVVRPARPTGGRTRPVDRRGGSDGRDRVDRAVDVRGAATRPSS